MFCILSPWYKLQKKKKLINLKPDGLHFIFVASMRKHSSVVEDDNSKKYKSLEKEKRSLQIDTNITKL